MRLVNSFFMIITTLIPCIQSHAESFVYQPGMNIELGRTWNPGFPNDVGGLGNCLDITYSKSQPNATEQFTEGFVEKFEELQTSLSLNVSGRASARYGLARAEAAAEFGKLREAFRNDRSIVYVVTGRRNYTPVAITGITLSSAGETILAKAKAESKIPGFYRQCGETVVTSVSKVASVSLVYVFTSSNSGLRDVVRSSISASVSSGAGKGGISANVMEEVRKVDKSVQVHLEVIQSGLLDRTTTVKNIVGREPGDMKEIRKVLQNVISGLTWESAAMAAFTAERLDRHLDLPAGTNFEGVLNAYSKVDSMREMADLLVQRILQLRDVLDDIDSGAVTPKVDAEANIRAELAKTEAQLEDLVVKARLCIEKTTSCAVEFVAISKNVLKYLNVSFGSFAGWRGTASGNFSHSSQMLGWASTYWPEFALENTKYIKNVKLYKENTLVALLDAPIIRTIGSTGILSFQAYHQQSYTGLVPCRAVQMNTKCNPLAANTRWQLNDLKSKNSDLYRLEIQDIEGNKSDILVPFLKDATF